MRLIVRTTLIVIALALCVSCSGMRSKASPSWRSVHLVGKRLLLVMPSEPGHSLTMRFSKKFVSISECSGNFCTSPLLEWAIENNRLSIGQSPNSAYTLVSANTKVLITRGSDGKMRVWAINPG